jgi:hypothetical protein
MKPTHDDLRFAIAAIGDESVLLSKVRPEAFEHLATIGLIYAVITAEGVEWQMTPAGEKLLPAIIDGNEIPPLI